jgi:hypothetical protein
VDVCGQLHWWWPLPREFPAIRAALANRCPAFAESVLRPARIINGESHSSTTSEFCYEKISPVFILFFNRAFPRFFAVKRNGRPHRPVDAVVAKGCITDSLEHSAIFHQMEEGCYGPSFIEVNPPTCLKCG